MENVAELLTVTKMLTGLSESKLADYLGVARSTLSRLQHGKTKPSDDLLEKLYSFAYENPFHSFSVNDLKMEFFLDLHKGLLFHGTRSLLDAPLDLDHSRTNVDLGRGFYLGETYQQAASYVAMTKKARVYVFKTKTFGVELEWMLAVAYYRGELERFKDHPLMRAIVDECEKADVIIAPIADNNMYELMNRFARGYITDLAATRALSASNLGLQHIFRTQKALDSLEMIDECFLCSAEKKDLFVSREKKAQTSMDKAKISLEKYRREGKYVEELFK